MEEVNGKILKPLVFITPKGYVYFDYNEVILFKADGRSTLVYTIERKTPIRILHSISFIYRKYCNKIFYRCHRSFIINLMHINKFEVKTHKLFLKNDNVVSVSEECLKLLKQLSGDRNTNYDKLVQEKENYQFIKKMRINNLLSKIFSKGWIVKHSKEFIKRLLLINLIMTIILFFCSCESKDRFYRPNLPEKLCCIGIIDIDGTTHYISTLSEFLDNRNSTRYISIEKSFQSEYLDETNDSLRKFSFTISTPKGDLFNYQSDQTIKDLKNFQIPDNLKFIVGEMYFFRAKERDTPEITAEVTVPEPPSALNLISVHKEMIALSEPLDGWGLDEVDSIKSGELRISFNNDNKQKKFYALIMVSKYKQEGIGLPFSGFLNFDVRESNSQGFFAELHDLKVWRHCITEEGIVGIKSPVMAYFIDGRRIPGNKCYITLSTKFHGPFSVLKSFPEKFSSLRIKLLSIPEELYLFEKSLYTYDKIKNDPFSEPVYLNGNIKGGNGIFAICRSTDLTVDLSPPY